MEIEEDSITFSFEVGKTLECKGYIITMYVLTSNGNEQSYILKDWVLDNRLEVGEESISFFVEVGKML